ncbi:MAG: Thymidylate synthase complementing protein [Bacteriophage sp.]|nr:MAG: Thymidylate synthase complementing protein [Bacteriophage sp.]
MSGSKKVFTTLGSSNHVPEEREAFDYYATDPRAVEMLLELEQFSPVIWEPACGEGHISKVLQAHGYEVISTDLIYRGFGDPEPLDFLKETLDDFEGDIITNPPYSMGLEFVQRALESVRHRMASYCQESTRYCNYGKGKFGEEITVIEPCFLEPGSRAYDYWRDACEGVEIRYFDMLAEGCTPQEARSVLPNSLKTEVVMTANIREWRHFLKLRCSPAAHPQMREVALILLDKVHWLIPVCFDDIWSEYHADV